MRYTTRSSLSLLPLIAALSGCGAPLLDGVASGPMVPSDTAWDGDRPVPTAVAPAPLARSAAEPEPFLLPGEATEERAPAALAVAAPADNPLLPSDEGWEQPPSPSPAPNPVSVTATAVAGR